MDQIERFVEMENELIKKHLKEKHETKQLKINDIALAVEFDKKEEGEEYENIRK